jgi:hypothetical protein
LTLRSGKRKQPQPWRQGIRSIALALAVICFWAVDAIARYLGVVPRRLEVTASIIGVLCMFTFCIMIAVNVGRRAVTVHVHPGSADSACTEEDPDHAHFHRRINALSRALSNIHVATGRDVPADLQPANEGYKLSIVADTQAGCRLGVESA